LSFLDSVAGMGCQPSVAGVREELGAPAYDVPQDSDSDSVGSPRTFCVTLQGGPGSLLGATLADWTGEVDGAVVAQVSQGGLLHEWNRRSPDNAVEKGDVIVQVNGATGYWNIISQIKTMGSLEIAVQKAALEEGSPGKASRLNQDLVAARGSDGSGSLLIRVPRHSAGEVGDSEPEIDVVALPITRTPSTRTPSGRPCDFEQEQCCICLQAFESEENLVQMPCTHDFHAECMYKWLQHSSHGRCPRCSRSAFDEMPGSVS